MQQSSRTTRKSRQGCQSCRLRHLKCDDLRPSCARCQAAGRECIRDVNIRFKHNANPSITSAPSGKQEYDFSDSQPWVKTAHSNLMFMDETREVMSFYDHDTSDELSSDAAATSDAVNNLKSENDPEMDNNGSTSHRSQAQDLSAGQMDIGELNSASNQPALPLVNPYQASIASEVPENSYHSPSNTWTYSPRSEWIASPLAQLASSPPNVSSSSTGILQDSLNFDPALEVLGQSAIVEESMDYAEVRRSFSKIYLDEPVWPLSSKEEAGLLRYYVERLARDFDLTDPYRHFRTVVPQRAATCPLLLNAIYALSARHLSRVGDYDPLVSNRYHQECLKYVIPVLDDSSAILDENLLASTIILRHLEEIEVPLSGQSPGDRQSHLLGSHAFIKAQKYGIMSKGLRQSAFWVGLRQEIYVAFVNQRAIEAAFEDSVIDIDRSCEPAEDHIWSCRIVALCADVICFSFGPDEQLASTYSKLSDAVEQWHSSKPSSFTPVYHKEADTTGIFPEVWFLSDEVIIGWQHFYIAKILLSAHNPRVPRIGPGRAAALKAMDEDIKEYVRILCGIAISNPDTAPNFTYASMSVVIAGDKFTERHEQEALMDVLNTCDVQYGFPTGHACENLKAAWGWTSVNK